MFTKIYKEKNLLPKQHLQNANYKNISCYQARNQLRTPGGKSFLRGTQDFLKLCPTHFSRGAKNLSLPGYGPVTVHRNFRSTAWVTFRI